MIRPYDQLSVLLAVESLKKFGGELSKCKVLCLKSDEQKDYSTTILKKFDRLEVEILPVHIEKMTEDYPFSDKIFAGARAEEYLENKVESFVWLDSDTMFIHEPSAFHIDDRFSLAYKPVHCKNIGIEYKTLLDPFWEKIYNICDVNYDKIFSVISMMDRKSINFYINAGCFVSKTKNKIFNNWLYYFNKALKDQEILSIIESDKLKKLFFHQAILSAVILNKYSKDSLLELPFNYNYPLHMHISSIESFKPLKLQELVTVRYDDWEFWPRSFDLKNIIQIDEPHFSWLKEFLRINDEF